MNASDPRRQSQYNETPHRLSDGCRISPRLSFSRLGSSGLIRPTCRRTSGAAGWRGLSGGSANCHGDTRWQSVVLEGFWWRFYRVDFSSDLSIFKKQEGTWPLNWWCCWWSDCDTPTKKAFFPLLTYREALQLPKYLPFSCIPLQWTSQEPCSRESQWWWACRTWLLFSCASDRSQNLWVST